MAHSRSSHRTPRSPALLLAVLLAAAAAAAPVGRADIEADRKECTDQLLQLQPCLPYVSKQGPKPTPDCCASLKQVLSKSLRCLCILIKDKDDPSVKAFKIDIDRALGLPRVCDTNATTSVCPKLLNLAPDSPEAKMFKDVDGKVQGNSSSGNPGPATASSTPTTASSSSSSSSCGGGALRPHYYAGMGVVVSLFLLAVMSIHGA